MESAKEEQPGVIREQKKKDMEKDSIEPNVQPSLERSTSSVHNSAATMLSVDVSGVC
jgi:hypothetical protein